LLISFAVVYACIHLLDGEFSLTAIFVFISITLITTIDQVLTAGCIWSLAGIKENRDDDAGNKKAVSYFQRAAGVFGSMVEKPYKPAGVETMVHRLCVCMCKCERKAEA
jgi:hypothetical protein